MTYTDKGYTEAEIMEALDMIRDICHEQHDCEDCPFADRDADCRIQARAPEDWYLRNDKIWRAFE